MSMKLSVQVTPMLMSNPAESTDCRPIPGNCHVSYSPEPSQTQSTVSTIHMKRPGNQFAEVASTNSTTEEGKDLEKATWGTRILARRHRKELFGNDTQNLYSPRVEFIATFVVILLVVSANLSISARPEQTLDMNEILCRFLHTLDKNTSLETNQTDVCRNPLTKGNVTGDTLVFPHSQGVKLVATSLASGLATMVAIYIAGGLSSAHLNPIVTLSVKCVENPPKLTWYRCVIYICVQIVASFFAGLVGIVIHYDAINHKCQMLEENSSKPTDRCIGQALYLVPSNGLKWWGAFLSDTTANMVFILIVMALRDKNNSAPEAKLGGLISGLTVTCLGLTLGLNTGGAINPVRDFGPRLAAAAFGVHSWSRRHYWAVWGPWVVPFLGGAIGASLYKFGIKPISAQKAADLRDERDRNEERDMQKLEGSFKRQTSDIGGAVPKGDDDDDGQTEVEAGTESLHRPNLYNRLTGQMSRHANQTDNP